MHESDRGCALFAAAYLDMALGKLLRACFVQSNKLNEDLFVGQNPLSTFSSMTKFAFYLGKISASERKDLDTIRLIRNELAHNAKKLTFTDQAINMRCGNLVHNSRDKGAQPPAVKIYWNRIQPFRPNSGGSIENRRCNRINWCTNHLVIFDASSLQKPHHV